MQEKRCGCLWLKERGWGRKDKGESAEQGTFVLTETNRSHHSNTAVCECVRVMFITAVYYVCRSQYVYMTPLWLRTLITDPQFLERSLEGPSVDTWLQLFRGRGITIASVISSTCTLWRFALFLSGYFVPHQACWRLSGREEEEEREKRVKESEWETGKSESRSWVSAESRQLRKQWIKFGLGRASVSWGERRAAEGERMDGWMWREKKGESEALGRATQSRLQMCRQQQCGCFGPHQAALGVSPAHVPTPPVNHPSQASGNTAATKPLRPDPQNGLASDRQTPMSPLCRIIPVIVSLPAYAR